MRPIQYDDFEYLTFDVRPSGVVVVTLNRPDVVNAAKSGCTRELSEVWSGRGR